MQRNSWSRRRLVVASLPAAGAAFLPSSLVTAEPLPTPHKTTAGDREQWMRHLERVSEPVLNALHRRELRRSMPVEAAAGQQAERAVGTHLEALGRLLAGMAPWLEADDAPGQPANEQTLRARYRAWAQEALASAVDPASPDRMRFGESAQTLVDSSFLSLALLRAPKVLLASMDSGTRTRLLAALASERHIKAPFNNWLLFAALNEVLLRTAGVFWDPMRVDYALREHESWYEGDGTYGDGPHYHADFYNSYVIHPYLLAVLDAVRDDPAWAKIVPAATERAQRYAAIQERLISPEGEFPVLGRSITYRAGAFHLLADVARRHGLPATLKPAAVRGALTAVQARTLDAPGTFAEGGWLRIGLAGHQPSLGETYISTGSLYLCSVAWLPLGLAPADPFWADADAPWTQKAVWAGQDAVADHAIAV